MRIASNGIHQALRYRGQITRKRKKMTHRSKPSHPSIGPRKLPLILHAAYNPTANTTSALNALAHPIVHCPNACVGTAAEEPGMGIKCCDSSSCSCSDCLKAASPTRTPAAKKMKAMMSQMTPQTADVCDKDEIRIESGDGCKTRTL